MSYSPVYETYSLSKGRTYRPNADARERDSEDNIGLNRAEVTRGWEQMTFWGVS
jgi:hypothetical protein